MKKLGVCSAAGHSQAGRAAPRVSPGVPQLTRGVGGSGGLSLQTRTDARGMHGPACPTARLWSGDPFRSLRPKSLRRRFWARVHGACPLTGAQHGAMRALLSVLTSPPLREAHGLSQVRSLGHLLVGGSRHSPQVSPGAIHDLGREPRAPPPRPAASPTFAFCPALTLDSDACSSCTNLPMLGNVLLSLLDASDLKSRKNACNFPHRVRELGG